MDHWPSLGAASFVFGARRTRLRFGPLPAARHLSAAFDALLKGKSSEEPAVRPALATPLLKALVVAALTAATFAPLPALAASKSTARASADLPIRSGPGTRYSVIGTLKKNAAVHLEACTRSQNWCLFLDKDGDEVGWVRGSYLIGSGAKNQVTPSRLFDDDWGLFPRNRPFFEHDRDDGYDD